ncbi:MAG: HAMP domain-containing histidine kinase [Anaerolineae bacterium]|nr:HAMP domain-containing histidine kinase [Anaerolineae bacterium]
MFKRWTIRQRILITFLAIVLTGGVLQLIIAGRQLQLATLEFYQHHLETDGLMLASTLSESLEHYLDGEGTESLQRLLGNLQQDTNHNYLIIDHNYRVVGYTAGSGYESIDRVPPTPELAAAAGGQIGADIRAGYDGEEYLFVAVPVMYERETRGYLVLSRPMQPAYTEIYQQWLELGSTTLPVIILVIIAGLWLSSTISRPVQQLRNSALKMAKGELDTRIESDAQDEVGQLARTFNYMAEQIEHLLKTQRSFVSNAAHELRTPLMTLKLRVEALQDETLPAAERAAYLAELREEIDHMAGLVSSLLVLARIDEGRHRQNSTVTDTTSALHDIARHWRIEARDAGLDFEAEIPADLPELPLAPNDLRLVLDNLLGNAIKYTPQGKIYFIVEQKPGELLMQVGDSGVGFHPTQAEQLFTRFYRADEARVQFEGNGLGLSIVQSILDQYGGSVNAQSAGLGQGAIFTLRIPVVAEMVTP